MSQVLWKQHISSGFLTAPVFGDGLLFIQGKDQLTALDAATGSVRWQVTAYSGPVAVSGTTVFYTQRGYFVAADTRTGTTNWMFPNGGAASSAAVVEGTVFVGSQVGNLYALDETTGELRWQLKLGDTIPSDPAFSNGLIYVAANTWESNAPDSVNSNSRIVAVDATSGQQVWEYQPSSPADGRKVSVVLPLVGNGLVFCIVGMENGPIAGAGDVYAVDSASGAQVWHFNPPGGASSQPAYADGVLYVGSQTGRLFAIDATRGTQLWSIPTDGLVRGITIAGGVLYYNDGAIHAVEGISGNELWSSSLLKQVRGAPIPMNDALYVYSDSFIGAFK